jgi:large subunit ribosomal protein L13e
MIRPIVKSPKGKLRIGKGFSIGELREAGLTIEKAKKLRISIDRRRKTVFQHNIDKLKKIIGTG